MNIKTITCHNVYNYGASLQAYALQNYLEQLGHNVEIIDFQPYHQQYRYNIYYISKKSKFYKICKKYRIVNFIIGAIRNRRNLLTIGRKYKFDSFTSNFLHLTQRHYVTSQELKENPPIANAYIAGSDQIWNTENGNGQETAYFADFGGNDVKRYAYAASFGVCKIQSECRDFVKGEVNKIDKISVRESSAIRILNELGIDNAIRVLDPVFLLCKEQWHNLAQQSKKYNLHSGKYILVYDFFCDERIKELAYKIKSDNGGMPIVSINDFRKNKYADININDAGPLEFLSLLENAHTVLSSSFHATSFSVIFKKDFYVFPLKGYNNSARMEDFLSLLGLGSRFLSDKIEPEINYSEVDAILEREHAISAGFLNQI